MNLSGAVRRRIHAGVDGSTFASGTPEVNRGERPQEPSADADKTVDKTMV